MKLSQKVDWKNSSGEVFLPIKGSNIVDIIRFALKDQSIDETSSFTEPTGYSTVYSFLTGFKVTLPKSLEEKLPEVQPEEESAATNISQKQVKEGKKNIPLPQQDLVTKQKTLGENFRKKRKAAQAENRKNYLNKKFLNSSK